MSYEGVKYRMIRVSDEIPSDVRIDELRKWCAVFHARGLAPHYPGGTHGNMSFRVSPDSHAMVITAARSSFAQRMPDDVFLMVHSADLHRMMLRISGAPQREPSSEAMLHYAIYASRPDVHAILHGHCRSITERVDRLNIAVTRFPAKSGTLQIVNGVLEVLDQHNFVEIREHGFLAMAESIEAAGRLAMRMLELANETGHD